MKHFRIIGKFILIVCFISVQAKAQCGATDKPIVSRAVAPAYPQIALTARAVGLAIIEISIDKWGKVVSARKASGINILGEAALNSARKWMFCPSKTGTPRKIRLRFHFQLIASDSLEEDSTIIFSPPYTVEIRKRESIVDQNVSPE